MSEKTPPILNVDGFFSSRVSYFVRCAEFASLTEAAARIGITQAALSTAIKQLETEVGVRLFERQARGVTLTPAGAALLDVVRTTRSTLRDRATTALGRATETALRVGSVVHFGVHTLVPLLDRLRHQLPPIQLGITWSLECLEAVRESRLDFAFISWTSTPKGVQYVPIREDRQAIVGLAKPFRAIATARSMRDLLQYPWIEQPKPQRDWTSLLPADRAGYVVRDAYAFRELVLGGAGITEAQLDTFTEAEQKKLVIARLVPPRYHGIHIYAVFRHDIRRTTREQLDLLLSEISAEDRARRRTPKRR